MDLWTFDESHTSTVVKVANRVAKALHLEHMTDVLYHATFTLSTSDSIELQIAWDIIMLLLDKVEELEEGVDRETPTLNRMRLLSALERHATREKQSQRHDMESKIRVHEPEDLEYLQDPDNTGHVDRDQIEIEEEQHEEEEERAVEQHEEEEEEASVDTLTFSWPFTRRQSRELGINETSDGVEETFIDHALLMRRQSRDPIPPSCLLSNNIFGNQGSQQRQLYGMHRYSNSSPGWMNDYMLPRREYRRKRSISDSELQHQTAKETSRASSLSGRRQQSHHRRRSRSMHNT